MLIDRECAKGAISLAQLQPHPVVVLSQVLAQQISAAIAIDIAETQPEQREIIGPVHGTSQYVADGRDARPAWCNPQRRTQHIISSAEHRILESVPVDIDAESFAHDRLAALLNAADRRGGEGAICPTEVEAHGCHRTIRSLHRAHQVVATVAVDVLQTRIANAIITAGRAMLINRESAKSPIGLAQLQPHPMIVRHQILAQQIRTAVTVDVAKMQRKPSEKSCIGGIAHRIAHRRGPRAARRHPQRDTQPIVGTAAEQAVL